MSANKKLMMGLGIIGLIVAAGIGGTTSLKYLTGPSRAAVITTDIGSALQQSFNRKPVAVHGAYASFTYPAGLKPLPTQAIHGNELAVYSYGRRDVESWQLTVAINRLAEPTLDDDNAYELRKLKPDTYQPSTLNVHGLTFKLMTDTSVGGFSRVAFTLHGNQSADISLYGDDSAGTSDLTATLQQVLYSWKW